jgi:Ca2+:H+ antiporter
MSDRAYGGYSNLAKGDGYADAYAYKPVSTGAGETGAQPIGGEVGYAPQGQMVEPQAGGCGRECRGIMSIMCNWLNILLIFVPLGICSKHLGWPSVAIFSLNFVAIVPLAGILGAATESLACHTGQMVGGLLNATFGNAVEMIVTISAIQEGLVSVVQGSLLGSILSNLLLVLGMAFFAAGIREKESRFSAVGASANMNCLTLGSIALALPTIYQAIPDVPEDGCLLISRISSVVIAIVYVQFLVFQLCTHADMFGGEGEEEEAPLSLFTSTVLLLSATCCVAVCSEYLVGSIEQVSEEYGLPKAFIGVILLPIVGNAAEHATAVTVAAKGKMDLALGVAIGSSTQIVLFVVPFAVMTGWYFDQPMSLDFRVFDCSVLTLSVFLASSVLHDGSSNWLEGSMLVATYILIAIICWYIPDDGRDVKA